MLHPETLINAWPLIVLFSDTFLTDCKLSALMDPLSAVSLAGNIIQFVEFGSNLVCGSLEIYKFADGATSMNSELELITEDLTELCSKLVRPVNFGDERLLPKAELDLLKLSRSCGALGRQFQEMLRSLKVKGRNRKWDSVRQALKSQWKAKDIKQYQERLDNFRSEIACHLLSILRYYLIRFARQCRRLPPCLQWPAKRITIDSNPNSGKAV